MPEGGEFSGTDAAETTITLSQLVELGGKRGKRRATAALGASLAGWDFETRRLDVLTATSKAFIAVLAAQERLSQTIELAGLAERFSASVSARADAGKVSPVEKVRAQVPLAAARIAQNRARLTLKAERTKLAVLWGAPNATFAQAVGSLEKMTSVPPQEQLMSLLAQNPDVARWTTEEQERQARLTQERANAIPDLTLFAGGAQSSGNG